MEYCDKIIVMDQGEIIEEGTHEELLEKKGQYYRLWEMQQGNFVVRGEVKSIAETHDNMIEEANENEICYT